MIIIGKKPDEVSDTELARPHEVSDASTARICSP